MTVLFMDVTPHRNPLARYRTRRTGQSRQGAVAVLWSWYAVLSGAVTKSRLTWIDPYKGSHGPA